MGSSQDHAPGAGEARVEAHPEGKPVVTAQYYGAHSVVGIGSAIIVLRKGFAPEVLMPGRPPMMLDGTEADAVPLADGAERHDAAPDAASGLTPKDGG